jgi:type II secretory pathway component PulF
VRTFEYSAVGATGQVITGRQAAQDELHLDRELEGQGLTLTRAKVLARVRSGRAAAMSRGELISFTTQLATVISAGVPIVGGLSALGKRMRTERGRTVVEELVRDLEAGQPLSKAMERQSASFPTVFRASISAGELSGNLPRVLKRLAAYLEWVRAIRATTIQALVYPCILATAVLGLTVVLITFVLPRIIGLFPGGRDQLPKETRLLLSISEFMTGNWVLVLLGVGAAVAGFVFALRRPKSRCFLSRLSLSIPRYGEVSRMLATSKFASTAATLQQAGCEVYKVLGVAGEACGNAYLASRFAVVKARVERGQTITESLEHEPIMDPLLVQLAGVGEQSGDLADAFEKLSDYYDQEVPRMVKWFLSLLEPAILLVGGVVVAFVLLAALLPVFNLYDSLG